MTLLYPQNPYISRENAILIVKIQNRILKFKVTLYPIPPGPVEADPRVLRAMGAHILGQFDPEFTALMNETMEMERYVFQTQNKMTYLVDTTSRGGLETVLTGAICPGEKF